MHRQPLGRQFAHDDVDRRQHQRHRRDRHRLGGAAQESQRGHQRFGQGDRRGRRRQIARQRDAELDRPEEPVGVAGQSHQCPLTAAVAALQSPQLPFADGDQSDLAAGEQPVEQQQHQDERDVEPVLLHRECPFSRHKPGVAVVTDVGGTTLPCDKIKYLLKMIDKNQ